MIRPRAAVVALLVALLTACSGSPGKAPAPAAPAGVMNFQNERLGPALVQAYDGGPKVELGCQGFRQFRIPTAPPWHVIVTDVASGRVLLDRLLSRSHLVVWITQGYVDVTENPGNGGGIACPASPSASGR